MISLEAKKLANKEALIAIMDANAEYDGNTIIPNVTAKEFNQIQTGKAGLYDITFSIVNGKGASKTVKLTVLEDGSEITPDGKGYVYAENKQITQADAKTLENKEELIKLMNVSASYDGKIITPKVTAKNFTEIKTGTIGIYDIRFSIQEGNGKLKSVQTNKDVKLTIMSDESVTTPDGKGNVSAMNAEISVSNAKGLTSKEDLVSVMKATASYDGVSIVPAVQVADFATINQGKLGTYDVTFSIENGQKAEVSVELKVVSDEVIVKPELDDTGILSTLGIYGSMFVIVGCVYTIKKRRLS